MKRTVFTIVIGTFILFAWNAFSWMVLPFHAGTLHNIPEAAIDRDLLQENLPKDGVYHYPGIPDDMSPDGFQALEQKLQAGPRITLMVYKKGETTFFNPTSFALTFVFNLLTVIALLTVVRQFRNKSLKNVVWNTVLIGLIIGLVSDLPQMNWYMFPVEYTLTNISDHLVSFLCLGFLFGLYTFREKTAN